MPQEKVTSFKTRPMKTSPGDKIYDIFNNQEQSYKKAISLSLIVFSILVIAYRANDVSYDPKLFFFNSIDPKDLRFFIGFLIAITSSVLASFLFASIQNKQNTSAVTALKGLAPDEFYKDFLNDLAHYQGIIRDDHTIKVAVHNHPNRNDIFLCDLTYSYYTNSLPKDVKFKVYRIARHGIAETLPRISDECRDYEFLWHNGEYDMPSPPDDTDYLVTGLVIGDEKRDAKRIESSNNEIIEYCYELPKAICGRVYIKYKITIPVELETILSLTPEFLTYTSAIEFNYRDVSEKIKAPCVVSHAGMKDIIIHDDDDGSHTISQCLRGWVLPRSGWAISWWRL